MAWYLGTTTPLYLLGLFFGSGIIAFAFHWFGIFSPGDAKLFWGLCLIFPVSLFRNLSGALGFAPLVLALNIIVPYSIAVLGYLLFKFVSMQNKRELLRHFVRSNFQNAKVFESLFSLIFFIGVGTVLTSLLRRIGWEPDPFLRLVFVLVAFTMLQKLLSLLPKTLIYYTVIGGACLYLAIQAAPSLSAFLTNFAFFLAVYFLVFFVAKQLILSVASVMLDSTVEVGRLQPGMVPAEQIVRVEQADGSSRYEKRQIEFSRGRGENVVISPDPVGLTDKEIEQLQHLTGTGAFAEFSNQIKVQPAIRFAPIITVGVLLTILCQGPFYLKLTQFF